MTLIELLVSITVIVVLMALLLPAIAKATLWCYEWAYGCTTFKNDQIRAYLNDDAEQWILDRYATNGVHRWKSYDGVRLWPADAYQ